MQWLKFELWIHAKIQIILIIIIQHNVLLVIISISVIMLKLPHIGKITNLVFINDIGQGSYTVPTCHLLITLTKYNYTITNPKKNKSTCNLLKKYMQFI